MSLRGNSGRLRYRLEHLLNDHVIGDDDLVEYQTVQFQQQGVRVLLVIRAQGRTQFFDLFLDEAKLLDDGAVGKAVIPAADGTPAVTFTVSRKGSERGLKRA